MKLLTNTKELTFVLNELLKLKSPIKICSFGIFAGITKTEIFPNLIGTFLTKLEKEKIENDLIVSYYTPKECPDCKSTKMREEYFDRVAEHIKKWDLNFYLAKDCHLKAVLVEPDRVIIGGINPLSASSWDDLSMYVRNKRLYNGVLREFEIVKSKAVLVNKSNVDDVLRGLNE